MSIYEYKIKSFIEDLEQLLTEVSTSIDSAMLTDDFVVSAERALVIPNIGRETAQVERYDDSPDTP